MLLRKYESSHNSGKHAVYNFRVDGVGKKLIRAYFYYFICATKNKTFFLFLFFCIVGSDCLDIDKLNAAKSNIFHIFLKYLLFKASYLLY